MPEITLDLLLDAVVPGGGSCLVSTTELEPAGGPHSAVAPAKFKADGKNASIYAYEKRYLNGQLRTAVLIDSKQSQLNRMEAALQLAIEDGHPTLSRLPRLTVTYQVDGRTEQYSDLTLPHRPFDGHLRAATLTGTPVTALAEYRAIRDCTPANARVLLESSPITLIHGGWDATRRSRQGRWRSALVGEIIGFCADQETSLRDGATSLRGGARVDPVAMQIRLRPEELQEIVDRQADEMSLKSDKIGNGSDGERIKNGRVSTSSVGLGGIPPVLNQLAGVACDRIIRTHVLSLAALRQMRFGAGSRGDQACRALLAALALNGLARSDAELDLRANCDLVEAGRPQVTLDQRWGQCLSLASLGVQEADALLAEALAYAETTANVRWSGPVLEATGNPAIVGGAVNDAGEG
jgi:CRISPR-associated protein Csb1